MADASATSSGSAPRLTVFGGLRLHHDLEETAIGSARQRAVLALLIAARGSTVTLTAITDALWPEEPPASAVNQIHRHVGELRRLMEPHLAPRAPGRYLHSGGTGYRLDLTDIDIDIEHFYGLADAAASVDTAEAQLLRIRALQVAAVPGFSDLPWDLRSLPSIARIDNDRRNLAAKVLASTRTPADAEAVLAVCEAIASEDPLDERLQSELIRVMSLAGRRALALEHFEAIRETLAHRLGIDPGADLRAAHVEVLRSQSPPDARSTAPGRLNALPRGISSFVEREGVQLVLDDVTRSAGAEDGAVALLSGMGGIGKTTLAVHWARSVADQFPDGQLHVNLLGYDAGGQSLTVATALEQLLEQLGADVTADEGTRLRQYQELTAGKRLLLLLDNARSAEQVRPLLLGSRGCLTIVTSRDQLASLIVRDGARAVPLARWGPDDSRQLLLGRLGDERVSSETDAVDSIISSCAGLPLALALAAARSVLHPNDSMPSIARELASRIHVLDSLAAGEQDDLRSTFELSYRALRPEVARLFRHLAVHPGPVMSMRSVASVADRPLASVTALAGELARANMVSEPSRGTLELHDLLRAFADELLDSTGERPRADRRLVDHYVWSTREAFLCFGRPPTVAVPDSLQRSESVETFRDIPETLHWYARERGVLHLMVRRAVELGLDLQAGLLALDWRPMNQSIESPGRSIESCTLAYEAAVRTGDKVLIADLARDVGAKHSRLGDMGKAEAYLFSALRAFEELGDFVGQSSVYRNLSQNAGRKLDHTHQVEFADRAVDAARRSGRPDALALALAEQSQFLPSDGDGDPKRHAIEEALAICETSGIEYLRGPLLLNLAFHFQERDEPALAWEAGEKARADPIIAADPTALASLEIQTARTAHALGLLAETRAALRAFDELMKAHEPAIRGALTNDFDDHVGYLTAARAWAASQPPS